MGPYTPMGEFDPNLLAILDPNSARNYDPLGDAPPPAPLPEHEEERARLRTALVSTRSQLQRARRALRMVLADPVVRQRGQKTLAPWWGLAQAVLSNREESEDGEAPDRPEAAGGESGD